MTNIRTISIPKPCHQSWRQMTKVNNGRHCEHCCKTVIDFTSMSNEEIIAHLSTSMHVCGRFGQHQLNGINYDLYVENLPKASWWKWATVFIGMLGPFLSYRANAQAKPIVVNTGDTPHNAVPEHIVLGKVLADKLITVNGRVIAKDDGLPIPGATVKLKGTNTGVFTNGDGKFTINVRPGSVLVVAFVGYETQQISIANNAGNTLDIKMQMTSAMMGEVVIVGAVKTIPKCKKAWRRVKGLMGVHSELAIDSIYKRSGDF